MADGPKRDPFNDTRSYHRIVERGEDSERFHRVVWGSLRGGAKSDAVYRVSAPSGMGYGFSLDDTLVSQ
jgi:hypothetical protein